MQNNINKLSKNPALGPLGAKFFAYTQMKNIDLVQLGELQPVLNITATQERTLLERLSRNGYIFRLQRGIYIVPTQIPAGGYWRPNDYLIIWTYMNIKKAKYYIGGLTAFNKFGFTTQIPNQYTVYNDKIYGLKKFSNFTINFIKINKDKILGLDTIKIQNSTKTVNIANLARTVFDAINDWRVYQTLPQAYLWLKKHYKDNDFTDEFISLVNKIGKNNTIRRVGFILDEQGVTDQILLPLLNKLKTTKSWVELVPNKTRKGKTNKKWGVINNVE